MEDEILIIQTLESLVGEGKYEKAVEFCDEHLKSEPYNVLLLRKKSKALYEIGKIPAFEILLDCTKKILEQRPDDIESLILKIRTLRRLNRIDDAKMTLELAEEIESDHPKVLFQKSSILIGENRFSAAKKVLAQLSEMGAEKETFINYGAIAWEEKRYDDALHYYSRHLDTEQDNFIAARCKSWIFFEMGRYDEAVSTMKDFIENFGERRFRIYRDLACLYFHIADKYSIESSKEYDFQPCSFGSRTLDESDEKWNDEKFRNTRKHIEYLRKAWEVYEVIDEKEIHNSNSRYWKARTCMLLEDSSLGTEAIDDCLEEEENWDILSHQASFLKRQGKIEEAIKICDKVLKDYPNDSTAISVKTDASYWGGDLLEYRRLFLKYHSNDEEVKKELTRELSLHPEKKKNLGNLLKIVNFLVENVKGNMDIIDKYFKESWYIFINEAAEKNDSLKKIRAITSLQTILSTKGMDPIDRIESHRHYIKRFNESFKDKKMSMIITRELSRDSSETKYHDRYLISNKNVWNITSSDIIEMTQRADIIKLENQETIDSDIDRFEKLWNREKNFEITGSKKSESYIKLKNKINEELQRKEEESKEKIRKKSENDDNFSFYA